MGDPTAAALAVPVLEVYGYDGNKVFVYMELVLAKAVGSF